VAGLTLDAGALIAAERGDRSFWALWERSILRDVEVTVPANVLAQVYRGARSAVIRRLVGACVVEVLDERLAMEVGLLCAKARARDVVDVSVVVGAASRGDHIVTSDARDIRRIAAHARGVGGIIAL
jgi:predicted nucleic acid-binding protein